MLCKTGAALVEIQKSVIFVLRVSCLHSAYDVYTQMRLPARVCLTWIFRILALSWS